MTSRFTGVSGRLFPAQYLAEQLSADLLGTRDDLDQARRGLGRWWRAVADRCGPASGLRAIVDLAAMPLTRLLGFDARTLTVHHDHVRGLLETPAGARVAFLVLPWSERPPSLWRDVSSLARDLDAKWCLVMALPFLSVVEARGFAWRRSVDFDLPVLIDSGDVAPLLVLAAAAAFDPVPHRGLSRIEDLVRESARFHARVRDDLQAGVAEALEVMSHALAQPERTRTRRGPVAVTRSGALSDQALTVIYRILFLLFAESRHLVPHQDPLYAGAYAVGTLCREAQREVPRFSLWDGLAATTRLSRLGCRREELIVSPFNGALFARAAAPALEARRGSSRAVKRATDDRERAARTALVALGSRPGRAGREMISYRDLGVEQLGAVYERVLDLDRQPESRRGSCHSTSAGTEAQRASRSRHSQTRKQGGTFYTPQALAEFVVRRTLAPLVAGRSSDGILALRVVDPAMGSGAFLVAACRYLAGAYARARIEEGQASPADFDSAGRGAARRLVAEQCLAGVDSNPVAVQLARLSLWLTTLARGKPLTFLDHRLRVGDSLVGATPEDLQRVHGERRTAKAGGRATQDLPLFAGDAMADAVCRTVKPLAGLIATPDDTVESVRRKEAQWQRLSGVSGPLFPWRQAATLWCARWFWPPDSSTPSAAELRALQDAVLGRDRTLREHHVAARLATATRLGEARRFFHWPLEFPDVFYDETALSPRGGFDAVIGNPPWEMLRREPAGPSDPVRQQLVRFIRESGLYPSCDRGHVNLYQPFVERALSIARPDGRFGLIMPWGMAVDDGAASLRRRLLDRTALDSLVGLDNRQGLFPIHRGLRFLVAVGSAGGATEEIRARFGVAQARDLALLPERGETSDEAELAFPVRLTRRQILAVGGPTLRIPDARRPRDLDLLERLAAGAPRLGDAAGWSARFGRELNATECRGCCGASGLPVLEGKHIGRFSVATLPALRIERGAALRLLPDARFDQPRLGYRDVSGVANSRSLIAAIVPAGVVTTHTVLCLQTPLPLEQQHFLCGVFNSYVLNAVTRLLMGGHITTGLVEQLPMARWRGDDRDRLIALLAMELAERPEDTAVQAVLEAHVARRYALDVGTFEHLLESFPLVDPTHRAAALTSFRRLASSTGGWRAESEIPSAIPERGTKGDG